MRAFFFFKQTTAYEMRISDWSSDVCSSDLRCRRACRHARRRGPVHRLRTDRRGVRPPRPRHARRAAAAREQARAHEAGDLSDRKSVVEGKSVSVRVDLGGRRINKNKKNNTIHITMQQDGKQNTPVLN